MRKVSARWCSVLLGASLLLGIPKSVLAQTSLSWAKVERLRNRVHLIPSNSNARLARVADVMNIGDALRTASSARAELRFNDGSLARIGEQATFRFTPDTRNFQLSNGTVLLLIPPGRGRTTIQTPNAVTGIQGSALFVRVRCLAELSAEGNCDAPITFVGALTNNPAGAMIAYNEDGSQQQPIYAGEIVVIEAGDITERFEFDLRTFYKTSGLVEGLQLDSSSPPPELSEDLQGVWQEIQDALELQGDFDTQASPQEVVENPGFVARVASNASRTEPNQTSATFASFPSFASSPAAAFHGVSSQIAIQPTSVRIRSNVEVLESSSNLDESLTSPVTSARVIDNLTATRSTPPEQGAPLAVNQQPTIQTSIPLAPNNPSVLNSTNTPVVDTVEPLPQVVSPPPSTPAVNVPAVAPIETPVVSAPVPAPVVTTAPVETPVITPTVVPTAVPDPVPVVATQDIAPQTIDIPQTTPAIDTPVSEPIPELVAIPDVEQPREREALPEAAFNWNQPAGANTPEVLETPDLPEAEIDIDSGPALTTEPGI